MRVGDYDSRDQDVPGRNCGRYRELSALQGRDLDCWLTRYPASAAWYLFGVADGSVVERIATMNDYSEEIVDLLIMYDRTNALGSRTARKPRRRTSGSTTR
jgi:hypothetical protein